MEEHIIKAHWDEVVGGINKKFLRSALSDTPFAHCPECNLLVARENLPHHILKLHCAESATNINRRLPDESLHPISTQENESDPIGVKVIKALERGQRYIANFTQRCEKCNRRIIFLNIGNNCEKAFDVDDKNNIVGTHACDTDTRSQSLYAYRGGMIDSNRRRH